MAHKKGNLEFRYYEVPLGEPLLALFGEPWIRPYGYDEFGKPLPDLHFHNLLEVGYCFDGEGTVVFEEQSFPYKGGTITVIPKNYPHTTNGVDATSHHWEYLFIDVEKALSSFYPDDPRHSGFLLAHISRCPICTTKEEAPALSGLILSILKEMERQGEMYAEAVCGLMRTLFIEIARRNSSAVEGTPPTRPKPDSLQITRALEYVGNYFARPLRVEDLAEVCHMSETHFRRVFGKCMGVSPVEYINQVRIRAACERLKKTTEPITDIAEKCGFCSLATFNRNFRRYMGTTPTEWRKLPEAYEWRLSEKNILMYDGW